MHLLYPSSRLHCKEFFVWLGFCFKQLLFTCLLPLIQSLKKLISSCLFGSHHPLNFGPKGMRTG